MPAKASAPVETFATARCFVGGPQTGKTQRIVDCALDLLRAGEGDVVVLCATPAGVRDVQERLLRASRALGSEAPGSNAPDPSTPVPDISDPDVPDSNAPGSDALNSDTSGFKTPAHVRVELARDAALRIMGEPTARQLFGRTPRLLESFEERFLTEDVRMSQIKGRRLREVLEFLRCGWTRLADDDEGWLITLEEEAVVALVRDNLRFTGGILPCELGNFAVNTLRASNEARMRHSVEHVLVDDYPLLDYASQTLARMLARSSLALAGDPTPVNPAFDEYPYFEGFDAFIETHQQAHVTYLEKSFQPLSIACALSHLRGEAACGARTQAACDERAQAARDKQATRNEPSAYDKQAARNGRDERENADAAQHPRPHLRPPSSSPSISTPHADAAPESPKAAADAPESPEAAANARERVASVRMEMADSMADELRVIAQACVRALDAGKDVLVVSLSSLWRANARKNLAACGLPLASGEARVSVRDFRDERACAGAMRATMERLARDPHDGVAWRSFVGFGDYVARSAGLEGVRKAARAQKMGIEEALRALSEGSLEGIDPTDPLYAPLAEAYTRCRAAIANATAERAVAASSCANVGASRSDALRATISSSKQQRSTMSDLHDNATCANMGKSASDNPRARSAEHSRCPNDADACSSADDHGCTGVVRICSPQEAAGLQASLVIFGGFVNGIIPSRAYLDGVSLLGDARARAHLADVRTLYAMAGRARDQLLLTGFSHCSLEAAERLELHIAHIRLKNGTRTCTIEPSELSTLLYRSSSFAPDDFSSTLGTLSRR